MNRCVFEWQGNSHALQAHADADWAGDRQWRHDPAWKALDQSLDEATERRVVATSSAEAELYATVQQQSRWESRRLPNTDGQVCARWPRAEGKRLESTLAHSAARRLPSRLAEAA